MSLSSYYLNHSNKENSNHNSAMPNLRDLSGIHGSLEAKAKSSSRPPLSSATVRSTTTPKEDHTTITTTHNSGNNNNSSSSMTHSPDSMFNRSRTMSVDREERPTPHCYSDPPAAAPPPPHTPSSTSPSTWMELQVRERVEKALQEKEKQYQKMLREVVISAQEQFAKEYQQKEEQMEKYILEETENFKREYKNVLECEYRNKKSSLEAQLKEKEAIWMKKWVEGCLHSKEMDGPPSHEGGGLEKVERESQAVIQALEEVTAVRERLLREQMDLKAQLQESFEEKIKSLQQNYNTSMERAQKTHLKALNEKEMEVKKCQEQVERLEQKLNEKTVEVADLREKQNVRVTNEINEKLLDIRQTLNDQWLRSFEEERRTYQANSDELRRQVLQLQQEKSQLFSTFELSLEEKVKKKTETIESQLSTQFESRIALLTDKLKQKTTLTEELEKRNNELQYELEVLQQELVKIKIEATKQRAQAEEAERAVWHDKLAELERTYEQSLASLRSYYHQDSPSNGGGSVPYQLYKDSCQRVIQLEANISDLRQQHHQALNAAIAGEQATWRKRLEEERGEQREQEKKMQKQFEQLKESLLNDLAEKERYGKERLEKEREKMAAMYATQLKKEQSELTRQLDAVRVEYDNKMSTQLHAMEKALKEKWESDFQAVHAKEEALLRKETELTLRQSHMEDEARRTALNQLKAEREALSREVETQRREVAVERERLTQLQMNAEENMSRLLNQRLEENEIKYQLRLNGLFSFVSHIMEEKEQLWLETRAQEMRAVHQLFLQHTELFQQRQVKTMMQSIQEFSESQQQKKEENAEQLQETLRGELQLHWSKISADLDGVNTSFVETLSTVLARSMEEHYRRIQEAWEEKQNEATQAIVQYTENKLSFEEEMRTEFEQLLAEENQNMERRLSSQLRLHQEELTRVQIEADEARDQLRAELEELLRDKTEKLTAHYKQVIAAVESQLAEVKETSQKMVDEKQRELDERIASHQAEKRTLLEEQTETQELHLAEIRAQCEAQVKEAEEKVKLEKEKMELEYQEKKDSLEQQIKSQYDKVVHQLETELASVQERWTSKELEIPLKVQELLESQYGLIQKKYETFVQEQTAQLALHVKEKSEMMHQMQTEQEETIAQLTHTYEKAVMDLEAQLTQTAEAQQKEREASFQKHMEAFRLVVDEERRRRKAAEEKVHQLLQRVDTSRSMVEVSQLSFDSTLSKKGGPSPRRGGSHGRGLSERHTPNRLPSSLSASPSTKKHHPTSSPSFPPSEEPPQDLDTLMGTLQELYEVLEVDEKERKEFLSFVEALQQQSKPGPNNKTKDNNSEVVQVVQNEIQILQSQLPLLELWVRYNQLQEEEQSSLSRSQLLESGFIQDSPGDSENPPTNRNSVSRSSEYAVEMQQIVELLREGISRYEVESGRPFVFGGRRVREMI